jgi:ATP-dependent protease ClpP protease subunit
MSKPKKNFQIGIRNSLLGGTTLELYFLDDIDDHFNYDDWSFVNMVEDVINRITQARPSEVIAYINSQGGGCDIGMAIYSYLKNGRFDVETRTLGMAGSIASVIAQAASPGRRYIAKAGRMVIHEAWGLGLGRAVEMRQAADVLDVYTEQICEVYADVSGRPAAEFRELIRPGDYWMTGQQSVEMGLADALFEDIPDGFELNNSIIGNLDPHYRNVPDDLKNLVIPPKNGIMKTIKEHISAFAASLKTKPINRNAPNLAEEVANVIGEPLTEMLTAFNDDVEERLAAQRAEITTQAQNSVRAEFETRTTELNATVEAQNTRIGELETAQARLTQELSDKNGGESGKEKPDPALNGIKPIGRGVVARVDDAGDDDDE